MKRVHGAETLLGRGVCFPVWGWQGDGLCSVLCHCGNLCVCACVCACTGSCGTLVIPRFVSYVTRGVPLTGCGHPLHLAVQRPEPKHKRMSLLDKHASEATQRRGDSWLSSCGFPHLLRIPTRCLLPGGGVINPRPSGR